MTHSINFLHEIGPALNLFGHRTELITPFIFSFHPSPIVLLLTFSPLSDIYPSFKQDQRQLFAVIGHSLQHAHTETLLVHKGTGPINSHFSITLTTLNTLDNILTVDVCNRFYFNIA